MSKIATETPQDHKESNSKRSFSSPNFNTPALDKNTITVCKKNIASTILNNKYSQSRRKRILPLSLPKHTHSEITFSNKLSNITYDAVLTIASKQYDIEYLPKFSTNSFQFSIGIQCSINDECVSLFLNTSLSRELFSDFLPIENIPDLNKTLKISLIENILQPLFDAYSHKTNTNIKVEGVFSRRSTYKLREQPKYVFSFSKDTKKIGLACIYSKKESEASLKNMVTSENSHKIIQKESYIDRFLLNINIIIGELTLSARSIKSLGLDDILIIKKGSKEESISAEAYIQSKSFFKASCKNTIITIENKPEIKMESDLISDDSENLIENIEDLEVNLTFELGKTAMSLKMIKTLSQGHTFELENASEMPVSIFAGKHLIAKAELLDIDGNIGARVKEIINGSSQ